MMEEKQSKDRDRDEMVDAIKRDAQDIVLEQRTVSFQGDLLVVLRDTYGNFTVSIPSLCNALGLNTKGQLQRLKRSPALSAGLDLLPVTTPGGRQHVSCLQSAWISSWLASLKTTRATNLDMLKLDVYLREFVPALYFAFDHESPHVVDADPVAQPDILVVSTDVVPPSSLIFMDETSETEEGEKAKMLAILTSLSLPNTSSSYLSSTSSDVDRSLREATLASEDQWEVMDDTRIFSSSNALQVYLGSPKVPLNVADAQTKIRQLGGSTVLTARVALGLWNLRRHDSRLSVNGSTAIRFDEILAWRGVQKHHRPIYSGGVGSRTDGYRIEQKQQVLRDLELLASCCVRGDCTVMVKGRQKIFYVNGPYLRFSVVTTPTLWNDEEVVGFFVSPGDWISTYETYTTDFLADIDRRVFQMNPQNEQHELRLALYLIEQWRDVATQKRFDVPIVMEDLLAASMIPLDTQNLTRFATRIESALTKLWQRGILGEEPRGQSPVDKSKGRWKQEWLASLWRLVPPQDIIERYTMREVEQRTQQAKKRLSRKQYEK